jgi:hypothetical protein
VGLLVAVLSPSAEIMFTILFRHQKGPAARTRSTGGATAPQPLIAFVVFGTVPPSKVRRGRSALTYANPGLTNPVALPSGAPSCAAYTNTTDCMNICYSVAANIAPTTAGAIGKGYQSPAGCRPDPYFPTWLKGIVYLHVSGESIIEATGLITKPCGL